MKIKKAFDICKKNKIISIFGNEKGEQWLSDGYAVYPIFGLPELNEDYICKLYDINDAQRDKIRFTISQTKPNGLKALMNKATLSLYVMVATRQAKKY